jgi:type IV secretion system protein VirD4
MQLPPTEELVLVSGMPPIRARKVRYYEDPRFARRVLSPPPELSLGPEEAGAAAGDWSAVLPGDGSDATEPVDGSAEDPANAGLRREPMLPEHEAIASETPVPAREFAELEDEPDDEAVKARAVRRAMRVVARQAAMDPDDGISL